jgi:hypothetical protein
MMPLFRQERCAPRAPIRCHADFTSHERQHRLAQHDNKMSITKMNDEKLCDKTTESECLVPMQYYSLENTSKFCTEGSVKNLLYMLRLSEHDVTVFWDLATAPLHSISECICDVVLKIVCNHFSQVNLIQKCLWILWKQFKFTSTKKMNCCTSRPSRIHYEFFNYVIFQYCSRSTAKMLFMTMLW